MDSWLIASHSLIVLVPMMLSICNKARFTSALISKHFFNVQLTNLMQISARPLLWRWYDDKTAHSMLRFLQNSLNFSQTKLPASDIVFLGTPYSTKWFNMLVLSCLLIGCLSFLLLWICCGNLQEKDNTYYVVRICLFQWLSMASLVLYGL